jgi:two-component system cell cycle sensor histidine kinase/response regulator CckA
VVRADACQLKQVLLNLCLNARDAMPDGGQLTLETVELNLPQPAPNSPPGRRSGMFTRLRVSDTGQGMTPEVLERLFDAFFTTKPVGRGTGLGLSLVHSIVKQHEGWVEVQSEPGRGTRFDVYLPRSGSGILAAADRPVRAVRAALDGKN